MKNKKTILFALIYSLIVICYKMFIIIGGFALTRFGFYFSNIVSVAFILPFIYATIFYSRKDNNGVIGGKESLKLGLQTAFISLIIISIYNYIEFEWKWKELSVVYYNSEQYLNFLKSKPGLKSEDYPKIIESAIEELSAFKAVTAKIFVFILFSVSGSFMSAVFLKRSLR